MKIILKNKQIINQLGDVVFRFMLKIDNIGENEMQTIENAASTIKEIWSYQHPIMHTWFLLSAVSLCSMFAVLFFVI